MTLTLALIERHLDDQIWPPGPTLVDSRDEALPGQLRVRDFFQKVEGGYRHDHVPGTDGEPRYLPLAWEPTPEDHQGEFISDKVKHPVLGFFLIPESMPNVMRPTE